MYHNKLNETNKKIKRYPYNLTSIVFFPIFGDFTWRVSDCEELVGSNHRRCGGRLWKVVKRNNRSGSYIFNGCSVQIPLLPSKKVPFFKRASWASSLIYALFYEGALF